MLITEFGPNMTLAVRRPPALGRVFYVDGAGGTGLDTNNGIDPGTPFLTIEHALGECDDYRNDYIVVLDCWQQDNFPITVNKKRVHIIGVANPTNQYPKMAAASLTIDEPVFLITNAGEYSEIAGFDLAGGTVHGCIELEGANGVWIHHCWFGSDFASVAAFPPQDGIRFNSATSAGCLIEDCRFFGNEASEGHLTRSGILMDADASVSAFHSEIRRCLFQDLADASILLRRAISVAIRNNEFSCPGDVQGRAITLSNDYEGCVNCWINGNDANYGDGAMINVPYLDQNALNSNNWGRNYRAGATTPPA